MPESLFSNVTISPPFQGSKTPAPFGRKELPSESLLNNVTIGPESTSPFQFYQEPAMAEAADFLLGRETFETVDASAASSSSIVEGPSKEQALRGLASLGENMRDLQSQLLTRNLQENLDVIDRLNEASLARADTFSGQSVTAGDLQFGVLSEFLTDVKRQRRLPPKLNIFVSHGPPEKVKLKNDKGSSESTDDIRGVVSELAEKLRLFGIEGVEELLSREKGSGIVDWSDKYVDGKRLLELPDSDADDEQTLVDDFGYDLRKPHPSTPVKSLHPAFFENGGFVKGTVAEALGDPLLSLERRVVMDERVGKNSMQDALLLKEPFLRQAQKQKPN